MEGFLLARPDSVVRGQGVRQAFDDAARAVTALRDGTATAVVGALPFDPRRRAALMEPQHLEHTAGPWEPGVSPELPAVRLTEEIPGPAEHVARVGELVELLNDPQQPLDKIVAARSILAEAQSPLDPYAVATHLSNRHPRANIFATDLSPAGSPGATLIGASPEVLITRNGPTISLHPLAGTLPRAADPAVDTAGAHALLASTKNLAEHAFVVDWVRECLGPVCTSLSIPDRPHLVETHEVWHLGTPIEGVLADQAMTALDLARLLHPTPAVCGTPTEQALDIITTTEADRGFYGGAVGWCDDAGDGAWVVAIRSAELAADRRTLRAFGGGGLVAASDPTTELDETTAKLHTFLGSVGCPIPAV